MRVIAGTARSLKLKTPEGLDTRPTTDRIKETLFNMLQPEIPDAVFVDLFSGSGAIGIEALSRGARHAYFVENNKNALSCIADNLNFTHLADKATVMKLDVVSALSCIHEKHVDLVFMDPPYQHNYEKTVLGVLKDMPYISEDTLLVIEASLDTDFSDVSALGYKICKEKCYKTNKHVFVKRNV